MNCMYMWCDVMAIPLQEVERKHEAMLQMYGEKAEQAEELRLDIEDLKVMYRQQVHIWIVYNCDWKAAALVLN